MSSLPTPPRVNAKLDDSGPISRRSIEWDEQPRIIIFSASPRESSSPPPRIFSACAPAKSILKPTAPLSPLPPVKQRDFTPQPEDPLSNSEFLKWPLSTVISTTATLKELQDAYSLLLARTRSCVPPHFGKSVDHYDKPLFFPIRKHAVPLTEAIIRDLGRVLVDPRGVNATPDASAEQLPSPRETPSPKSKRAGMTEEQVKYARDVCLVTTATIKFLGYFLAQPAMYESFSKDQLDSILTAILAIPLAKSLPTPNSRKTYACALGLLQTQRLPASVLSPAKDRIVFAISRGLEGEFGREGKKGAGADSLKAVHDFASLHPGMFVPSFASSLPTILELLTSPILMLRIHACHALGGFVLGVTNEDYDLVSMLEDTSSVVTECFMGKDPKPGVPIQSAIFTTLKMALRNTESNHHAQGPIWALAVLANFVVLLGPALHKNRRLLFIVYSLLCLGLKTRKRVVRGISAAIWGPLVWAWQKWRGKVTDTDCTNEDGKRERQLTRALYWKTLNHTVQLPVGTAFLGAVLGESEQSCSEEDLCALFYELEATAQEGGDATLRVLDFVHQLIAPSANALIGRAWERNFYPKLLPEPLFSTFPGLLTSEQGDLIEKVECLLSQHPDYEDVRPLSVKERRKESSWNGLRKVLRIGMQKLELDEDEEIPPVFLNIWRHLLDMRKGSLHSKEELGHLAETCAETLIEILGDEHIDLRAGSSSDVNENGKFSAAALLLKLRLAKHLWIITKEVLPAIRLRDAFTVLMRHLLRNHTWLIPDDDESIGYGALVEFAQLTAQVAMIGAPAVSRQLFSRPNWEWSSMQRSCAWRAYAREWRGEMGGSWQGAAAVLGVPFDDVHPWDMSDTDQSEWKKTLQYAIQKASDVSTDVPAVLDLVASHIERRHLVTLESSTLVADILLTALDKSLQNSDSFPISLMEFVQETLITSYPPAPRNKVSALWMLRSLRDVIDACPSAMVVALLESLQEGLCPWLSDECAVFAAEEYSRDILPLYQTSLMALQSLNPSMAILLSLAPIFPSALCRLGEVSEALSTFEDFWSTFGSALAVPRSGWPEGVHDALEAVRTRHRSSSSDGDNYDADESQQSLVASLLDDETDELDMLPRSPLLRKSKERAAALRTTFAPRPDLLCDVEEEIARSPVQRPVQSPSTPIRTPKAWTTRPERHHLPRANMPQSPSSSPSRRALRRSVVRKALQRSPAVLEAAEPEEEEEKENASPIKNQRAALGINEVCESALGKRCASSGLPPSIAKRMKLAQRPETVLSPSKPALCGSDDSEADCTAVEAVLELEALDESPVMRYPLGDVSASPQTSPFPTRSPKRRWHQETANEHSFARPSKSLRFERDLSSSSDDSSSPVGPFTPRHHALPLQDGKDVLECSPSSDDSIMSDSPSRDHVSRRLRQSNSFSRVHTALVPKPSTTALAMKAVRRNLDALSDGFQLQRR